MTNRDEREAATWFRERYGRAASDAARRLEREVIGADFGANGFTTRSQADLISSLLELSAQHRLLDVGCGRGWPGLYLAKRSGCTVVLTDLPEEGLRLARRRAEIEHLDDRAWAAAASARRLPFRNGSFDAIVHTDVLC